MEKRYGAEDLKKLARAHVDKPLPADPVAARNDLKDRCSLLQAIVNHRNGIAFDFACRFLEIIKLKITLKLVSDDLRNQIGLPDIVLPEAVLALPDITLRS